MNIIDETGFRVESTPHAHVAQYYNNIISYRRNVIQSKLIISKRIIIQDRGGKSVLLFRRQMLRELFIHFDG